MLLYSFCSIYAYQIITLYSLNLHMLRVNNISIKLEKKTEKKKYLVLTCQRLSGWAQEYVFF